MTTDQFNAEDFELLSQAIEVAYRANAQQAPMVESVKLGARLNEIRGKLKAMIQKPKDGKNA